MEQDYRSPQEEKVGITHYLTPGTQIPAITKYLYSDFVVNEIDKFQQLVQLKVRPGEKVPEPTQPISYELTNELKEQMKEKIGGEAADSIEKLYYSLECGEKAGPWEFTVGGDLNRDQRIAIHDFVREKLTNIESTAVEGGKIRLKFNRNMRKMNPNARQKYTYFTLYKHGIDTFNALFRLSKIMGISNKIFSTAGLKDKRGHTTQLVSVYNTDLPTLQKFYKVADRNRELWIEDFQECKDSKLEVGGLFGNQFGLVLRLLDSSQGPELLSRVDSLREKGMVNYFGLQRFGQFSVKTYELGAMVLRK
jgi:tRNA pseudouridine13 synthase